MPELLYPLDSSRKFTDQQIVGHNRWHPDIPAAVTVKPGDTFRAHCREWFDGAIHNDGAPPPPPASLHDTPCPRLSPPSF